MLMLVLMRLVLMRLVLARLVLARLLLVRLLLVRLRSSWTARRLPEAQHLAASSSCSLWVDS